MDCLQKASSFSIFSIALSVRIMAALQHNDHQFIFKDVSNFCQKLQNLPDSRCQCEECHQYPDVLCLSCSCVCFDLLTLGNNHSHSNNPPMVSR